ncbi:hypothetical protein BOTBODRAFT_181884 [Botryobasidium botryosum FD-172 SS1]|uniref:Uncharacterized protein n=1 Tax=Botryobasidium botryosum (strain FD-172 SS1) TaxID=930990 RepID=A0A067M3I1_BOTB1|nr:hypothetical protein BOTBODRAFT_181884 [Botryobasidium botryosum FD-172 SS1]
MPHNITEGCHSSRPAQLILRTDYKYKGSHSGLSKFKYNVGSHPKYHIFSEDLDSVIMSTEPIHRWGVGNFSDTMSALANAVVGVFHAPLPVDTAPADSSHVWVYLISSPGDSTADIDLSCTKREPLADQRVAPQPPPVLLVTPPSQPPILPDSPNPTDRPSVGTGARDKPFVPGFVSLLEPTPLRTPEPMRRPTTPHSTSPADPNPDKHQSPPGNFPLRPLSLDGRLSRPQDRADSILSSPPSPNCRAVANRHASPHLEPRSDPRPEPRPGPPIRHVNFNSVTLSAPKGTPTYTEARAQVDSVVLAKEALGNGDRPGSSLPIPLPLQGQSVEPLSPVGGPTPRCLAPDEQADPPVDVSEMKKWKIRGLDEWCYWVNSKHTMALSSPLFNALGAKVGTLYLHQHDGGLQIWLRGVSPVWTAVTEGAPHLTLPQRSLLMRAGGQPSWIDKKTVSTYKTRPGKRRAESEGPSTGDAQERDAKRLAAAH